MKSPNSDLSKCLAKMTIKTLLLLLALSLPLVIGELFTAVVHLEKLLSTEQQIVSILDAYLASEENRLNRLKEIRKKYRAIEQFANLDSNLYLNNPVNSFLLVKSLTTDWKQGEGFWAIQALLKLL